MNIDNIEEFIVIDKRIDHAEDNAADNIRESIRDRWEFGVLMLARRKGKQLPKGMLDALAQATGKSRQELGYRMQFAERFRTDDELSNALETCTSWRQVIAKLPKPEPADTVPPSKPTPPKTTPRPATVPTGATPAEATARKPADEVGPLAITDDGEMMVIDWATMPGTAQAKIQSMRNGLARRYQRQVDERVEEVRAEYLDRLESERQARFARIEEDLRRRERAVRHAAEVYSAKGLIPIADYRLLLRCFHTDSHGEDCLFPKDDLNAAFHIVTDPKVKVLLVKGADAAGTR